MIAAALMTGFLIGAPALALEVVADQGVDPKFIREAEAGAKAWQELIKSVFEHPKQGREMRVYLFASSKRKLEAAQRIFGISEDQVGRALGLTIFGKLPIGNADAGTNTVLIRLDEPGFSALSPGYSVGKIAGHELTHLWQQQMNTIDDPAWLVLRPTYKRPLGGPASSRMQGVRSEDTRRYLSDEQRSRRPKMGPGRIR